MLTQVVDLPDSLMPFINRKSRELGISVKEFLSKSLSENLERSEAEEMIEKKGDASSMMEVLERMNQSTEAAGGENLSFEEINEFVEEIRREREREDFYSS